MDRRACGPLTAGRQATDGRTVRWTAGPDRDGARRLWCRMQQQQQQQQCGPAGVADQRRRFNQQFAGSQARDLGRDANLTLPMTLLRRIREVLCDAAHRQDVAAALAHRLALQLRDRSPLRQSLFTTKCDGNILLCSRRIVSPMTSLFVGFHQFSFTFRDAFFHKITSISWWKPAFSKSYTGWPKTWKTWNTQGFLWTWKTYGIRSEFCATSGKSCNKQSIFSSSFKYLCKTAVDWVNRIIRISGSSDPVQ